MKLLEKASRNQIRGLTYDKIKLVKLISPSSNQEMIATVKQKIDSIQRELRDKLEMIVR